MNQHKIWRYVNNAEAPDASPIGVDYKTGLTIKLQPMISMTKGRVLNVGHYATYDGEEFNDLIIRVEMVYTDLPLGLHRQTTRTWLNEDESDGESKVSEKYYDIIQAGREAIRRRGNIVDELTAQAEIFGKLADTQEMFRSMVSSMNSYTLAGDPQLIADIGAYPGEWLDEIFPGTPFTFRQAIQGALTI